jgi:hypothetical protein
LLVRPINEAEDSKHYIIRGGIIPARELVTITGAVTMNSSAILAANTHISEVSINAYGVEIS